MKVILAGPPRSGKSCLREGLKQAIKDICRERDLDLYPYIITACPDGEGAWFQETVNLSPEAAAEAKAAYKAKFTAEFVKRVADSVSSCLLPLVAVDIGGITSVENEAICASTTHAILLYGDLDRLPEWRAFCAKEGEVVISGKDSEGREVEYLFHKRPQAILAEIWSDYHGHSDAVPELGADGIWRGSIHYLERGEKTAERPTVRVLAEILIKMAMV